MSCWQLGIVKHWLRALKRVASFTYCVLVMLNVNDNDQSQAITAIRNDNFNSGKVRMRSPQSARECNINKRCPSKWSPSTSKGHNYMEYPVLIYIFILISVYTNRRGVTKRSVILEEVWDYKGMHYITIHSHDGSTYHVINEEWRRRWLCLHTFRCDFLWAWSL